jgi:Xaa-Pro dipeptidase
MSMPLHFSEQELAERRRRTTEAMAADRLDGMLIFRQETMFYLTGYDTFGYCYFQCLYLGTDGTLTLLTRAPDARQAEYTSMLDDIRVWRDRPDADPARTDLLPILEEHGCRGKRLGVEWEAYGLTGRNARRLMAALDGFCTLEDASELVNRLRVVKSEAEIAYVKRAAELADGALAAAIELAKPGAFEGDILAEMHSVIFKGDGDYPGNEFIIGSGPAMRMGRYFAGRRHLDADDVLTLEFAGVYRHYHYALYRTLKIGKASPKHEDMYRVSRAMLEAGKETAKPGNTLGMLFDAFMTTMKREGYEPDAFAYGYALGTTFAPNWMDWPMIYADNPFVLEPGMVFFLHPSVRDKTLNLCGVCGETILVTGKGSESLSASSLDYVRNT